MNEAQIIGTAADVLMLINRKVAHMNPALQRISRFIVENPDRAKSMTIRELSLECAVAESTITRFVRELGFASFAQLKIMIAESVVNQKNRASSTPAPHVYENITSTDNVDAIFDKLIHRNVSMLSETKLLVDEEKYELAAHAIEQAGMLAFLCIGSSAIAAEEAVMRFTRSGKKCMFFRDTSVQLMSSAILGKKDVLIGISNSGSTMSVVNSIERACENGVTTIGITAFPDSPLARSAGITLFSSNSLSGTHAVDHWENTSSKISQLLVIDVLYGLYASRNESRIKKHLADTYKSVSHTREYI